MGDVCDWWKHLCLEAEVWREGPGANAFPSSTFGRVFCGTVLLFQPRLALGQMAWWLNMILNRGPESDPAPGQHFWEIQVAKNSLKHLANLGNVGKDKNHSYFCK